MQYIIFLFDKVQTAQEVTRIFKPYESRSFKVEAYSLGHSLHGLHHNGRRPTKVINLIAERDGQNYERWHAACVQPYINNIDRVYAE